MSNRIDSTPAKRILLVEDEYLLADEMRRALSKAGYETVGPVSDIAGALRVVETDAHIDAAILDVNLGGKHVFALADELTRRAVPFAFTTGYDRSVVPERYQDLPYFEKPVDLQVVVSALPALLADGQPGHRR